MKNLLIIGAGPNQLPAIIMAKQRGYTVVTTDMDPDAPGFSHVDHHAVISTRDVSKNIDYAQHIDATIGIDGIMTIASECAITVAGVAHALDLPGTSPESACNATHKVRRQNCFKEHNVPSPRFACAHTVEEGIDRAEEIGYPAVIKPVDGAGSRGVQKVSSPQEMTEALSEIRSISASAEYIIEEFLEGSEHSIEGIVMDNEVYWTGFSDRNYDKKELYPPFFLEDGDTLPSTLSPDVFEEITRIATRAVHALDITSGPVKGDILVEAEGPKILEMAARLSGDYFCNETVPLHNGINILEAVMDMAVGIKVDPLRLKPQFNRGVALRYLWPAPGTVKEIRGLEKVKDMPGVQFFRWEPCWSKIKIGTIITLPRSMGERVGAVLAHADTREQAVKIAEQAIQYLDIITD